MNRVETFAVISIFTVGIAATVGILNHEPHDSGHHEDDVRHEHSDTANVTRGPHGGRILEDGLFSVEIMVAEDDQPPKFRLYAYMEQRPLPPDQVIASVETVRLGGRSQVFSLSPREDYLEASEIVEEPHSFDVTIQALLGDQTYRWSYQSYESRVTIPSATAASAGIKLAQAGPASIRETLLVYGQIIPDERRVRRVTARFPGTLLDVRRSIGERVNAGDVVALVESNESLEAYPVRSPISGVVTGRSANPGDNVSDQVLFTITDLSHLLAEVSVFRRDLHKLRLGQRVTVTAHDGSAEATGAIVFISPIVSETDQSLKVRVSIDNRDNHWQPGMFVTGEIELATTAVNVAVQRSALQSFRDFDVVFVNVHDMYEPRMLTLGRVGGTHAEVVSGLDPGDMYVAANSFLVKADIAKSSAGHDH